MNHFSTIYQGTRHKMGTVALSTAILGALALTACGGDAEPAEGRSVTVAQGVDPTTMDPIQQRETTTENVLQHLYDPLIRRDTEDPNEYVPALAESWEQVDETTWEFTLQEGVTFSDGSDFTADDVVYTVEYLIGEVTGEPGLLSQNFVNLTGAEAVDDHTVRLTTEVPDPLLMPRLPGLFIIPEDSDPDSLADEPVGTGAYELAEWDRNASVTLTAREDYFSGEAEISEVTFETIPDDSARLAGLNSGSVDLITNVSPDNIEEIEASGQAAIEETPSARIVSIWLNTLEEGPLQNSEVRRALNHAVDVETITETVMSGYGEPIATMTPEYFLGYDESNEPIPYDPELAEELLAEAGYADGFEMTLMVPSGRLPFGEDVAQAVQSYLGEVGVDVELDPVEFGVFADRTNSGNVDEAYMAGYGNSTFNPVAEYQVAVRTGDSGYALFSDETIDELIDQAGSTVEEEEGAELLSEIESRMLEEAPFIYLYAQIDLYGVSDRLDWDPRMDETVWLYDASVTE